MGVWTGIAFLAAGTVLTACGVTAQHEALPARLSRTGLYADMRTETLAEGVTSFSPQFELWSDGAKKRRWISLPPKSTIDKRRPDAWRFPIGTKLFKEFRRDGKRVETRLLQKLGQHSWAAVAYVWQGEDATAAPDGVDDVNGTDHDVPAARDCMDCHRGAPDRVLGYSAVQLEPVLSQADTLERAAIGYLHANCAHCHRGLVRNSCDAPPADLDLRLQVGVERAQEAAAYRTIRGRQARLLWRIGARGLWSGAMLPLATDDVDVDGVAMVATWLATF